MLSDLSKKRLTKTAMRLVYLMQFSFFFIVTELIEPYLFITYFQKLLAKCEDHQ